MTVNVKCGCYVAPDNLEALLANARIFDSQGDIDSATAYRLKTLPVYDKLLSIDPNNPVTLNDKANILYTIGNYTEAIKYYEKALIIDPNNLDIIKSAAQNYNLLGDYPNALTHFISLIG